MLCALIMAGGKGTRFWPLSTEEKPKQFLNLLGEETMIQMTVNRIKSLIPMDRIFICTGEKYVDLVKQQLPELDERNIIVEPEGRNTAPCIALSAFVVKRRFKDATMVVLPSDHLIKNEQRFLDILSDADEFLNDYPHAVLTLGMTPNRAETGYGYIESNEKEIGINNSDILKVGKFVEKPNKEKAEEYLNQGNYFWNGGMFLWKIDTILNLILKYLPTTYCALKDIETVDEENIEEQVKISYGNTECISIDYGIMEKCRDIFVIPSDIGWDDIGTWSSVERYRQKDNAQNIMSGDITTIKSNNNLIIGAEKPIVLVGIKDIFCVETEEMIFIGHKNEIENIKAIRATITE